MNDEKDLVNIRWMTVKYDDNTMNFICPYCGHELQYKAGEEKYNEYKLNLDTIGHILIECGWCNKVFRLNNNKQDPTP